MRLEIWADRNLIKFNKDKNNVLPLARWSNIILQNQMTADHLESCFGDQLRVLVNKVTMDQQCMFVIKKAIIFLGCINKNSASTSGQSDPSLLVSTCDIHLENYMQERHGYIEVTPAEMDSLDGSVRMKPKEEWRVGEQDVQEAEETIFIQPVKKKRQKFRGNHIVR